MGRQWATLDHVLRHPARRAGQVRSPDRRVAIADLRERYRPVPYLLRLARGVAVCISIVLLFSVFRQRDPYLAYTADPAGYDLTLTLLRAECGARAFSVTLDQRRREHPSPALADVMRQRGIRSADHDPWVGEAWFAPNVWEPTVLHRNSTPTDDRLRVRRNRTRAGDWNPESGWALNADGWFERAPRR